jgi:hypothetical protein
LRHHHQKLLKGFSQSEHVAPPSNDVTDSSRSENENLLDGMTKYLDTEAFYYSFKKRQLQRFRGINVPLCTVPVPNLVYYLRYLSWSLTYQISVVSDNYFLGLAKSVCQRRKALKNTPTPAFFIFSSTAPFYIS